MIINTSKTISWRLSFLLASLSSSASRHRLLDEAYIVHSEGISRNPLNAKFILMHREKLMFIIILHWLMTWRNNTKQSKKLQPYRFIDKFLNTITAVQHFYKGHHVLTCRSSRILNFYFLIQCFISILTDFLLIKIKLELNQRKYLPKIVNCVLNKIIKKKLKTLSNPFL